MDGNSLIRKVRVALQDIQTDWIQGEFWSDDEILLALNSAQDVFINSCLRNGRHEFLSGLVSWTPFWSSPHNLPDDYLHYISGKVGTYNTADSLKMARTYLGGIGYSFFYTVHDAVFILGNQVWFKRGVDKSGILCYWRRPLQITNGIFASDFKDDVYYNYIVGHATVLCGLKEIQTAREYKTTKRELQELVNYPSRIDNYIKDVPKTKDLIRNAAKQG